MLTHPNLDDLKYYVLRELPSVLEQEPQLASFIQAIVWDQFPPRFDQVIETILQFPAEQQEMLVEIIRHRQVENWREEVAQQANEAINDFHAGRLKPQPVSEIIERLRQTLNDPE